MAWFCPADAGRRANLAKPDVKRAQRQSWGWSLGSWAKASEPACGRCEARFLLRSLGRRTAVVCRQDACAPRPAAVERGGKTYPSDASVRKARTSEERGTLPVFRSDERSDETLRLRSVQALRMPPYQPPAASCSRFVRDNWRNSRCSPRLFPGLPLFGTCTRWGSSPGPHRAVPCDPAGHRTMAGSCR